MLSMNDPVIGTENTSNRSKEDGISTHERQECLCGAENLPWDNYPSSDDGGDDTSTFDVDVFREEDSQVVGGGDGVRGDVRSDLGDVPGCCGEEGCGTTAVSHIKPFGDDFKRVPDQCAVDDASC